MIFRKILSLIYPEKCIFCGEKPENNKYYCRKCYYKLPILDEENICLVCGRQLYGNEGYKVCPTCSKYKMHFDANYPAFIYEGIIKDALRRFKFTKQMWYYKAFGIFISERIKKENLTIDYIVYPPVNKSTFNDRGYSQAELLAEVVGKKIKKKVLKNAIVKIRQNEKQSLMSASKRRSNVKNVFKIKHSYFEDIKGKNILFVDDILTTGATMNECAKELKKAGAVRVYGATLCITR